MSSDLEQTNRSIGQRRRIIKNVKVVVVFHSFWIVAFLALSVIALLQRSELISTIGTFVGVTIGIFGLAGALGDLRNQRKKITTLENENCGNTDSFNATNKIP